MIFALALAAITADDIRQINGAYSDCVMQQTLRLGAKNHETADTILLAVRSICSPQWQAVQGLLPTNTGVVISDAGSANMLRHIQAKAEGDAVAALLEARLKTP